MRRTQRARFAPQQGLWLAIAIAIAISYLYAAPYYNNLNNPNENVRVYMTRAIVEHGTFAIDEIVDDWGYVNDKATFDGRLYPGKAPGTSYLAVPLYWVHYHVNRALDREPYKGEIVWICRLGASIIPLLVFFFFFAAASRRWADDPAIRMLGVVALAVGSTMYSYGVLSVSHAPMSAALFGGFLAVERHRRDPKSKWAGPLAGFLLGWAICLEYPAALGAVVIGIYGLIRCEERARLVGGVLAGAIVPGTLVAFYHYACFGGVFETPYQHLENEEFVEHVSGGFFGMQRIQPEALVGSYLTPDNGLFWFVPWTLVAIAGLPAAIWRQRLRGPAALTLAILLVYTLFIALVKNWHGGWAAGPRYIVPVVPFLAWYSIRLLGELGSSRFASGAFTMTAVLVFLALIPCGLAATTFPHYPPDLANPIFEVSTFFFSRGYVPYTFAYFLGGSGPWVLLPVAIALATAWAIAVVQWQTVDTVSRAAQWFALLALIALGFTAQSIPSTSDEDALHRTRDYVLEIWEPPRSELDELVRRRSLPEEAASEEIELEQLGALAEAAARVGLGEAAATLWRRVVERIEESGPHRRTYEYVPPTPAPPEPPGAGAVDPPR